MPAASGRQRSRDLTIIADLAQLRGQLREIPHAAHSRVQPAAATFEQLVQTVDELASNALRHGRPPATARVVEMLEGWLVDVSDTAITRLPAEDVDRNPARGRMGLYLVAAFATAHGWWTDNGREHVWAVVPRTPQNPAEPVLPVKRVRRAAMPHHAS